LKVERGKKPIPLSAGELKDDTEEINNILRNANLANNWKLNKNPP
jgi:hypothetical protein